MKPDRLREKIDKLLADNKDGKLEDKAFRDMLAQQILAIIGSTPISGKLGATVMTESASSYNPKEHGPKGPKPANL